MPYIKQEKREEIIQEDYDTGYDTIRGDYIDCAGDLNFTFTWLIKRYIEKKGFTYQTINDIIGALEGAKLEFYRREVAGLEMRKCEENGDVE